VYASPAGEPRARRATDVLLLGSSLLGLAALVVAYPPSRWERSLVAFLDSFPGWLDPVWGFLFGLVSLWAVLLVLAAAVRRRFALALEALGAVVLAVAIAIVSARLAGGHWPDLGKAIAGRSDSRVFPALRVTQAAAAIATVGPYLVRPLQTAGRWILALGFLGALFAAGAAPSGDLAGILIALVAAAGVRLAFGTSLGRPSLAHVGAALAELGVQAERLEPAERQVAGVFLVRGFDADGRRLYVKVYGRDAYDSRLIAKLWRTLWYRDGGPGLRLGRSQTAEHEAFLTLLARNAGVQTQAVVTAGATIADDALLVLRGDARPLPAVSTPAAADVMRGSWRALELLGAANIAHLRIGPATVASLDGEIGLVDFGGATIAPRPDQVMTDRAQLLVTTATLGGSTRALDAAVDSLRPEGVAALLPYLQSAALGSELRGAMSQAGIDIDELREEAARAVGVEPPELVRLRRLTWWSLIQVALLVLAAWALFGYFGGVDWGTVVSDLRDESLAWVAVGLLVAQLPRLAQAASTLGSVPTRLVFGPVYAMQLASSYMNLAVPSSLARMAVSVRFFQRQGLSPAVAVASGAIDSLANTAVQLVLIVLLLLFSQATLSLDLNAPTGDVDNLIWIVLGLLALSLLVAALVGRLRRAIVGRIRGWWPEVRSAFAALRASHKLALLFGGNLAAEILFATALGLFTRGFGYHIALSELLVINMSVSLLASFIPVPGGIGVVEFGLTAGLTAAGMEEEAALAAVILYRISTFYLPPVWGFFALRWLQRNRYL
jgi:uncharacterized membrane protein YbhN (UPF0104 family)